MLKSAQNYINQIHDKYSAHMYDIDYQWYFGYRGTELPGIEDHTYNNWRFASVDENDNVIGYISYSLNQSANGCTNFAAMSFDRGNLEFVRDIKQSIDDIFLKYNFDRLDFSCISGNPVLRNYRHFVAKHGGREVGTYRKCSKLLDGKLYDSVLFEILKEDYVK